jgi:hypothetical protein
MLRLRVSTKSHSGRSRSVLQLLGAYLNRTDNLRWVSLARIPPGRFALTHRRWCGALESTVSARPMRAVVNTLFRRDGIELARA